jgi:hypothetical protein
MIMVFSLREDVKVVRIFLFSDSLFLDSLA